MFPRLHIHATPETIRIELEGTGVLIEEEAVLAVFFDARSEDAVCVGVGEDALKVPDQIRALEPTDDPTKRASLVPREKARWLEGNRGLGVAPVERREDPWAHHGECVILRPFAPGMGGARAWLWLIARPSLSLLAPGSPRRLGFAKRWLSRATPNDRDAAVRGLRWVPGPEADALLAGALARETSADVSAAIRHVQRARRAAGR